MTGPFEDIRKQEHEFTKRHKDRIVQLQQVIALTEKVSALKGAPGWLEFVGEVEALRTRERRAMEQCEANTDEIRTLQGRCQALGSMLAIMRDAESNRKALAAQMKDHQDILDAHVRSDGKVVPQSPIGGTI
jgi:chromosome segregation ATPase